MPRVSRITLEIGEFIYDIRRGLACVGSEFEPGFVGLLQSPRREEDLGPCNGLKNFLLLALSFPVLLEHAQQLGPAAAKYQSMQLHATEAESKLLVGLQRLQESR
jgi:hypothetical protein